MINKENTTKDRSALIIKWIRDYLAGITLTQSICMLASLPFLICWGLPISLASMVGNIIFLPFLMLFLVLSSLIFFITLIGLTCPPLEWMLEQNVAWWKWALSFGSRSWLISFPAVPTWLLFFLSIAIIMLMMRYRHHGIKTPALTCLAVLFACATYSVLSTPGHKQVHTFVSRNGTLNITVNPNRTLTLIDYGYFNGSKDPEKTVQFNLRPWCSRHCGMLKFDEIILTQPTPKSMQAARALCSVFSVTALSMPWFEPFKEKKDWRQYFLLKEVIEKNKIVRKRLSSQHTHTDKKSLKRNKSFERIARLHLKKNRHLKEFKAA